MQAAISVVLIIILLHFYAFVLVFRNSLLAISLCYYSYHGRPAWWSFPFWQPAYRCHM